jgi:group I intron endonuclease
MKKNLNYNTNVSVEPGMLEESRKLLLAKIYKRGFPAIFQDMSKLKEKNYFSDTKGILEPINISFLKEKAGIYMLTNRVTNKCYIGLSSNIQARLRNYLYTDRLKRDGSSRINKALLKYGHDKFSVTILELTSTDIKGMTKLGDHLRMREDFFIKTFKPQYNIKRYIATRDVDFQWRKVKINFTVPTRIRVLLDKCLDPENLRYCLISFERSEKSRQYHFTAITPKSMVEAFSFGWHEGMIITNKGWIEKVCSFPPFAYIIGSKKYINKDFLQAFYQDKNRDYVSKLLDKKFKALQKAMKKQEKDRILAPKPDKKN